VVAEAGTGKSRLFYEFKATIPAECKLLEAYSVSHGKASAWLPVIELLREYFGIQDTDDPAARREKARATLERLDPGLTDTLHYLFVLLGIQDSPDPLGQMDPQIKHRRTLDAIKRIILRESLNQPTLVVFEDLHWIDGETQALLDLLTDSIANSRVLLLLNYRPEYRHEWTNKSYYSQLRLDALGRESTDEMLSVLLGDAVELAPLKHLIVEKTSGNPFFIEEMVHALFDQGTIVRNGSVKLTRQISELRLPPTVQGIVAARIDQLATAQKFLMQTLAVIGRESPLALIRAVASRSDGELEQTLAVLQAGEFIYEQPATSGVEYTFKHALTQEVAYNSLLIERRKLLHERIGAALETLYADRLDDRLNELAHHYRKSGNASKAIKYLLRAAYQARQRAAYLRAIEQLEAALGLVRSLLPAERDCSELSIRVELYKALRGTRGYAERSMTDHVKRARELCTRLGPSAEFDGLTEGYGESPPRRVALLVASTLSELWGVSFNGGPMEETRSLLV
jgi:predicted ATPase